MESEEKYQEISKLYGNALRIGMLESDKDKVKIAKLLRFESTRTNCTSLEEVCRFRLVEKWELTGSMSKTEKRVRNR